jgi:hypothetical protein
MSTTPWWKITLFWCVLAAVAAWTIIEATAAWHGASSPPSGQTIEHSEVASTGGDRGYLQRDNGGHTDQLAKSCDRTYFNDHAVAQVRVPGATVYVTDPNGADAGCGRRDLGVNASAHLVCSGRWFGCSGWSLH